MFFFCRAQVPGYVTGLHRHFNGHIKKRDLLPGNILFDCTFRKCTARYGNFYCLKRHIIEKHPVGSSRPDVSETECDQSTSDFHVDHELPDQCDGTASAKNGETGVSLEELKKIISLSICRMTSDVGLPQTKVSEFIKLSE